ncbi:MAG: ImmA/IrrE family metallo-endopeptidase [Lachnospiraceae bacterium]|nr:ImmA/IrrE family metallo-endopeptidase [Lachnospiraceae bacterium]
MSIQVYLVVIFICFLGGPIFVGIMGRNVYRQYYSAQMKFDIDFDEMAEAEQRLRDFMQDNNIAISDNVIDDVAQKLEVITGGVSNTIQNNAELIIIDGKKAVILKDSLNAQERTFCFAHECAHLIYGDPVPQTRPEGRDKDIIEQKADYLAAAMILPREIVCKFLADNNYDGLSSSKRVKLIDRMSKKYNVKDVVLMRRIQEVKALESLI